MMTRRRALQVLKAVPLVSSAALRAKEIPKAELSLKDFSGRKVRLSAYRGKFVLLNFWATWCVPCNVEMPLLVEAERQYRSRDVVFLGVSLDDSKTVRQIPEFLKKYSVAYP